MIRTAYVVDDDPALRMELTEILEAGDVRVESFASGEELLKVVDTLEPGCILLDLNMVGCGGLATQAELVARNLCHQIVVLTGSGTINAAVTALRAGASDFLEKPTSIADLHAALDQAFVRLAADRDVQRLRRDACERIETLSAREREVLACLVDGKANKMIAHDLGLSVRTVEIYRANLMRKLGARSLSEALKLSLATGEQWAPEAA